MKAKVINCSFKDYKKSKYNGKQMIKHYEWLELSLNEVNESLKNIWDTYQMYPSIATKDRQLKKQLKAKMKFILRSLGKPYDSNTHPLLFK